MVAVSTTADDDDNGGLGMVAAAALNSRSNVECLGSMGLWKDALTGRAWCVGVGGHCGNGDDDEDEVGLVMAATRFSRRFCGRMKAQLSGGWLTCLDNGLCPRTTGV